VETIAPSVKPISKRIEPNANEEICVLLRSKLRYNALDRGLLGVASEGGKHRAKEASEKVGPII
jgi:hypothetical protein